MEVTRAEYLWGYQLAVVAFGIIALSALAGIRTERRRGGVRLLLPLATIAVGMLFYQFTASIFMPQLKSTFGIQHLVALLTHVSGVLWNCLTLLLVVYWLWGRVPRRTVLAVAAFGALAIGTLVTCFVVLYPGPSEANFIVAVEPTVPGRIYIVAYAGSMLATKVAVLAVCVPQIGRIDSRGARSGLILVCMGSAMIAFFAICRLGSPYWHAWLPAGSPVGGAVETVAFYAHVIGALVYATGFGFVEVGLFGDRITRHYADVRDYLRLRPLVAAVSETETAVSGGFASPRWTEYLSPAAMSAYLTAAVVAIFDAAAQLGRGPGDASIDLHDDPSVIGLDTPLLHFRKLRTADLECVFRSADAFRAAVARGEGSASACARVLGALAEQGQRSAVG